MKISKVRIKDDGCQFFNLNIGGFTIMNCRWYPRSRRIFFPVRYDRSYRRRRYKVVLAYGSHVKRLRALLESGLREAPRDRRPRKFKIGQCAIKHEENAAHTGTTVWVIFNFTVRGFTILGCRWNPESGSIQLPVTFLSIITRRDGVRYRKKPVVCAFGVHINRLRTALELACPDLLIRRQAA